MLSIRNYGREKPRTGFLRAAGLEPMGTDGWIIWGRAVNLRGDSGGISS